MRWRLVNPAHTHLMAPEGDTGAMLFNPNSWQTHRVPSMVGWVVQQLMSGPQSRDDFLTELALGGEDLEQLGVMLDNSLAELRRLHIIVPNLES